MIFANVIFHAFEAAYVSWVFLAPLALLVVTAEGAILYAFNRAAPMKAIITSVVLANLVSYFVGLWISPWLFVGPGLVVVDPDEQGYGILDRGPDWQRLARYSFLQAGILSVAIEALVVFPFRRVTGFRHVIAPVFLGNCLSYVVLLFGFIGMFGNWPYHTPP